jgi:hypothetical protein
MIKLIKASCDNEYPLCVHYGFLVGDVVVHNTPDKTNPYGGNIVAQSFENFKKERTIYAIEDLDIPASKVWAYYEKHRTKKFNAITFNCEQFANDVISGVKKSSILYQSPCFIRAWVFYLEKIKKYLKKICNYENT